MDWYPQSPAIKAPVRDGHEQPPVADVAPLSPWSNPSLDAQIQSQPQGNDWAAAGFALSIVSFIVALPFIPGLILLLLPIVGIVLSAFGRRPIWHRGLATVGLVVSITALLVEVLVIAVQIFR